MGPDREILEYRRGASARYPVVFRPLARGQGLGTVPCDVRARPEDCIGDMSAYYTKY